MRIEKINIENYKCFEGKFSLELNENVNIIVGDNESGKSTILEAMNLALSGILNGRFLKNELSQYLFNITTVNKYLAGVNRGENPELPIILIEVYFRDKSHPPFEGNLNSERKAGCGLSYKIEFDDQYKGEYGTLIKNGDNLTTLPVEYYKITWKSFARETITSRSIPIKSTLIDSSSNRYQNGSDIYISRIIKNDLNDSEIVQISQAYRRKNEAFMDDDSMKTLNAGINNKFKMTNKDLKISANLSTRNLWENALMTYLDEVPFHQIGKGEQCIIKTNLALSHSKTKKSNLIMLEEPESHLSHTKLNELMRNITDSQKGKQILITTHSSFVANKLGLDNLILLNNHRTILFSDLTKDTYEFFKKLPGYNTLRLLFCSKAVLVEGPTDELVFQKAYMAKNMEKLPIENGIDVISVGNTFERFLEIAKKIEKPVAVITDNDRNYAKKIEEKYNKYTGDACICICADDRDKLNTLEPQFVDANRSDLKNLCSVIDFKWVDDEDQTEDIRDYMLGNKTDWALKVFESTQAVQFPEYINNAVDWCNGKQ